MIRAERLKLRRQRPLMAFAAPLSAGAVVAFQALLQLRHASAAPGQPCGPAGGEAGMGDLLKMQGAIAAIWSAPGNVRPAAQKMAFTVRLARARQRL